MEIGRSNPLGQLVKRTKQRLGVNIHPKKYNSALQGGNVVRQNPLGYQAQAARWGSHIDRFAYYHTGP